MGFIGALVILLIIGWAINGFKGGPPVLGTIFAMLLGGGILVAAIALFAH